MEKGNIWRIFLRYPDYSVINYFLMTIILNRRLLVARVKLAQWIFQYCQRRYIFALEPVGPYSVNSVVFTFKNFKIPELYIDIYRCSYSGVITDWQRVCFGRDNYRRVGKEARPSHWSWHRTADNNGNKIHHPRWKSSRIWRTTGCDKATHRKRYAQTWTPRFRWGMYITSTTQ